MLHKVETGKSYWRGKAQHSWPQRNNQFRSAPFYIENIIHFFYKTSHLNEVNCTEPSLLVSIPWFKFSRWHQEEENGKSIQNQGILTEGEGSVRLTSLY